MTTHITRTQLRRKQRKHNHMCLLHVLTDGDDRLAWKHLSNSEVRIIESVRQHAFDCRSLGHNVHSPSNANLLARAQGYKDGHAYCEDRNLH